MKTKLVSITAQIHRSGQGKESAFNLLELAVVIATLAFFTLLLLPTMARTRANGGVAQCLNNLCQLNVAWSFYTADNRSRIVSSYPGLSCSDPSWCKGTAMNDGSPASYCYGCSDPAGITNGQLWTYTKSLDFYRCPDDNGVALGGTLVGKPVLRSYSMNNWMGGQAFLDSGGVYRVFFKDTDITRPSSLWVLVEEDPQSINDGMLLVAMTANKFYDLPSRRHGTFYPINFADGHTETIKFHSPDIRNWTPASSTAGSLDFPTLTNLTTLPAN